MEYFKIGKFAATHGVAGDIILEHSLGKKSSFKGLKAFFAEMQGGNLMPYFIEKVSARNESESLVRLEGIGSKESAKKLITRSVWLKEEDFKKFAAKSAPISLLGYTLYDDETEVGIVNEVIEQPHQVICSVLHKGKEAMIPVHPENLIKTDHKAKKVWVVLPEGLLELYL